MKLKIKSSIISVTKKTGKNGEYVSLIMLQEGEVIDAYSKNVTIAVDMQEKEYGVEIKKYKGQYSSIRVI